MSIEALHEIIKPEFDKVSIKIQIDGNKVMYIGEKFTVKIVIEGNITVVPTDYKDYYTSNHLCIQIIQMILEFLPNIFKYCTVCGSKLLLGTNKIASCIDHDKECKYIAESMLTDDTVVKSINRDKETFCLLVNTAIEVCKFPDRLNPYPYYFKNDKKYFRDVMMDGANSDFFDMNKLNPIVYKIKDIKWSQFFENIYSDLDLYNMLDKEVGKGGYEFLKYVIKSNRANISSSVHVNCTKHENKSLTYTIDDSLEFYELKYHTSIESSFYKENTLLLFHGSSAHNWHPIMRTGIKNLSNTKLMSHGAAFGPGVYLAKDIQTAMGYCRGTSKIIVGACLVKNYEKYKKTENVYVVPNDNDILLK